jgi:signal transduction histidine kinase
LVFGALAVKELLHNPLLVKMVVGLAIFGFMFFLGLVLIKLARREITASPDTNKVRVSAENVGFSLAAYEGVIRKLKSQEQELERLRRSERERASESASLSEAVLSNLGSGVVLFNTASIVRQANPAAKTLMGFASPFGLHARDLFRGVSAVRLPEQPAGADVPAGEGATALVRIVELCARGSKVFRRIEADYQSPAGEKRVLGITVSPVRSVSDESLGAACLLSDLTEITHLSQQMRLRESMAALGEMSAGIAHEFKNSLATISGYAQMLQDEPGTELNKRDFAERIVGETDALSRIVNDFLNFAKPQGFSREEVELRPMIEDCAQEARLKLEFGEFPPVARIKGDPVALRQAFSNLLRNSVEAADAGQEPRVLVQAQSVKNGFQLTLKDNGCGIVAEQRSRIFIPFFTTKATGTGLGLALVHRIVTEHGGTVSVASDGVGKGTTFTLAFPLDQSGEKPITSALHPE